eukprot:TRINITY_DN6326_c0_g1_i4.p1 TRINITY_DN6326_c0_g1~~TRINITY_DN6326_c0_g1_i4.p1  ORF type:complete len:383 (-),score=74.76 TRINITY_DN6326_c0_g1_i4:1435-2583(-)
MSLYLSLLVLLSVSLSVAGQLDIAPDTEGWESGRATFYGNEYWFWNIHEGSCNYGYQCAEEGTGWDVAALPDSHKDFSGSCGTCYEVKCHGVFFEDSHSNVLNRMDACYDKDNSVVVRIVDACPCNDVDNYYSNNRWCCGDMDHLDLSIWAFEKLADPKWGVIGLHYRAVPCDHVPENAAPALLNPYDGVPPPTADTCPKGQWDTVDNTMSNTAQLRRQSGLVYADSVQNFWQFSNWNAEAYEFPGYGVKGGSAVCGKLFPGGAISFLAPEGVFASWVSLKFYIRGNDNVMPNIDVNLAGDAGQCTGQNINALKPSGNTDGYSEYVIYLTRFNQVQADVVNAFASSFRGCGDLDVNQIRRIAFINNQAQEQMICIDEVALLG